MSIRMSGYTVHTYNNPWGTDVRAVIIEDGVTVIAEGAFDNCSNLTDVSIPDTVTKIGAAAFRNCTSLSYIKIPETVSEIGHSYDSYGNYGPFTGCTNLLTAGYGDTYNIDFRWTVSIPDFAFYEAELTAVALPDGMTAIGEYSFASCGELITAFIPDSVEEIEAAAFYGCSVLSELEIPETLTLIGGDIFQGCASLQDSSGFVIVNGVLFDYFIPASVNSETVLIPNGVTGLSCRPLQRVRGDVKSIFIPESVAFLYERGFNSCYNLEAIHYAGTALDWAQITKISEEQDYINDSSSYDTFHTAALGTEELSVNSIPDPVFRAYISENIDSNEDGILSAADISDVEEIDVSLTGGTEEEKIKDLTGVGLFTNLRKLNCSNNDLSELDLSENSALLTLNCRYNHLSELDVSNCPNLTGLICNHNDLTELDLRDCPEIMKVVSAGKRELREDYACYQNSDESGNLYFALGVDPNVVLLEGDLIGRKNYNRFMHNSDPKYSDSGFVGVESWHAMRKEVFDTLIKHIDDDHRINSLRRKYEEGEQSEWGGSCSGLATTIALTYAGLLEISDISSSGAATYYDMDFPCEDDRLMESIQYYQEMDTLGYGGRDARIARYFNNRFTISDNLKWYLNFVNESVLQSFLQDLVTFASSGKTLILKYQRTDADSGHAVVITGCEKDDETGKYRIQIYDENCMENELPKTRFGDYAKYREQYADYIYMEVEEDFSDLTFHDDWHASRFKYMDLVDPYQMLDLRTGERFSDGLHGSADEAGKAWIIFNSGDSFCLESEDGKTLVSNAGWLSGDLEIYDYNFEACDTVDGSFGGTRWLLIPSGNYTLTGIESGADFTYFDDVNFYSLRGGNIEEAVFSQTDGITLHGENYHFDVAVGTDAQNASGESGLAAVTADGKGTFRLKPTADGVRAETDGELSNISAGAYTGLERSDTTVENGSDSFGITADGDLTSGTIETYTVSYSANGGSGAPAAQTKTHGTALTLSSARPTRSGYTFVGWSEDISATTAQYQPGGRFTKDASVTLYAVWKANTPPKPADPVEEFVRRCYRLILGREGEAKGVSDWTNALKSGTRTGAEIVSGFINSQEFFNQRNSNEQVVTILYRAMLGREPDTGGKASWVSILDGGCSYDCIVDGFSGSQEFGGICASYGIRAGRVNLTQPRDQNPRLTAFVNRNYRYALNRQGEAGGLNDWCDILLQKRQTPQEVAHGFVFSPECLNMNLDNRAFLVMLYHLYMDREPDESGLNGWLAVLNSGGSREEVVYGFAQSREFGEIVASYGL